MIQFYGICLLHSLVVKMCLMSINNMKADFPLNASFVGACQFTPISIRLFNAPKGKEIKSWSAMTYFITCDKACNLGADKSRSWCKSISQAH